MSAPSLDPSQVTCDSIRAHELRAGIAREILVADAIGMQALAAFLDADDAAGLMHLRRQWRTMTSGITPMAAELGRLLERETVR